ncbi:MAG TPA: hypothetical protein ENK63_04540 [Rhodobacterales bacterium]|nr:hypothetical protein [Rhodobacterales bacterium]
MIDVGHRSPRTRLVWAWVTLAALFAASALMGQTLPERLDAARAAEARLDFRAALSELAAAIASSPDAPGPRLLRAALHQKMRRPSLALADLAAVLERDPANRAALLARAGLLRDLGALSRALADYDHLLDAHPDDVAGLIGRARARTRSGLTRLARRDYDAALALAPTTPGLAAARAALDSPATASTSFDPALMMDPAFQITQGRSDAPHSLIVFHAGNRLAEERLILPSPPLVEAVEAGRLRLTHLFTYTGQDSAIWANRALLCAGVPGFEVVSDALATPEARTALERIDAGRGRDAFEAVLRAGYEQAGLDAKTLMACATDRSAAFAYLSEWSAKEEAAATMRNGLYDSWPVFVLDGKIVSALAVLEALGDSHTEGTPPQPLAQADAPRDASASPPGSKADLAPKAETERMPGDDPEQAATKPAPAQDAPNPASAQPTPQERPQPRPLPSPGPPPVGQTGLRIPTDLKCVWAASLAACIAYTDAIAGTNRIDDALPALNPLDGPPIGTVLLTSRGLQMFNAVGTTCAPTHTRGGPDGAWAADLRCTNAIDPTRSAPMALTRLANSGPTPRLSVDFGNHIGITLMQCRALGRLSVDFGRLWQIAPEGACAVRAPIGGGEIRLTAIEGTLSLAISGGNIYGAAPGGAMAMIDGVALASTDRPAHQTASGTVDSEMGTPDAGASQTKPSDVEAANLAVASERTTLHLELGDFATASETLARGLLLDLRLKNEQGRTVWARTIPLLGSGRAMAALADCAEPTQGADVR